MVQPPVSMKKIKPKAYFKGSKRYVLVKGKNGMISIAETNPRNVGTHPVIKHDFEEFIFILQGEIELEYPEFKKKWIMRAGSAKYHPPGTIHTAKFRGKKKVLILEFTSPPGHWP